MPKHAFSPIADKESNVFSNAFCVIVKQLFEEHFNILLLATFLKTVDVADGSESDVTNWLSRNMFTAEYISSFER
jgi:hypothetical protein